MAGPLRSLPRTTRPTPAAGEAGWLLAYAPLAWAWRTVLLSGLAMWAGAYHRPTGLLLAALFLRERVPPSRVAGALVIVCGLAVIGAESIGHIGADGVLGDLLFVMTGLMFAVFGTLLRHWRGRVQRRHLSLQLSLRALVEHRQQLQGQAARQPDSKLFAALAVDAQQQAVLFTRIADIDLMDVHDSRRQQ